jgi:AcrR family transcriptional regulator
MSETKENILQVALRLFARDGYEAVSVSMIAGELGMTKGALYKHYKNKRDIFDSIVERMKQTDADKATEFDVPLGKYKEMPMERKRMMLLQIKTFSLAMFRYWTQDDFAASFRKMLTLEQYRNPEMAKLLNQYLLGGVIDYAEELFREIFTSAGQVEKEPKVLAFQYFAPLYMAMNLCETDGNEKAEQMVEKHIDYFMESLREGK